MENENMTIQDIESKIRNLRYNIKIIDHYLDNPSEIRELSYIHSYDELLSYRNVLRNNLKNLRKILRNVLKEC